MNNNAVKNNNNIDKIIKILDTKIMHLPCGLDI